MRVRSYNRYHNKLLLRAEIWEECPCHKLLSNHLNSENQKEKETWFNIWFRAHTIPRPESKQHQIWQQIRADRENAERNYVCNKNRVSCYLPSVFFFSTLLLNAPLTNCLTLIAISSLYKILYFRLNWAIYNFIFEGQCTIFKKKDKYILIYTADKLTFTLCIL